MTEHDRIAVVADGSYAIVARTVRPPVYQVRHMRSFGSYGYRTGVPITGGEAYHCDGGAILALPTDGGSTVIGQRWRWAPGDGTSIEPGHTFAQFGG